MRLLHTADWHLGQTLHGVSREYEHARFLDWLSGELVARAVDLLLVAGDVFDGQNPPVSAQRQLFGFLAGARRLLPDLAVVMIAGNHDSGGRLEAPSPLLE
ncbi:MAG: exonuclease subunit SbcD, partial [Rhodospirillaceae bacterium]